MSDQSEKIVASPEDITNFLKTKFVFTDNIPEDMNRRRAIVMEARASILIDSYCTSGRFPTFMKDGRYDESGWVYKLPDSVEYQFIYRHDTHTIALDEFKIVGNNVLNRFQLDCFPIIEILENRWQLYWQEKPLVTSQVKNGENQIIQIDSDMKNCLTMSLKNSEQTLVSAFGSKFERCKYTSPYNTPEKVCRFFGNSPFPFAPLKLNNSVLRTDIFHGQVKAATESILRWKRNTIECSEEDSIQLTLSQIISKSQETSIVSPAYDERYENWLKMVYTFKNKYKEPIMKVAKLYNTESQTKSLIPMTMWMRNHSTTDQLFCVPLPEEKQPLYNLDQLTADPKSPVILTDSIELADANELEGVIFTSFICDSEQYDQVDWSPLLNRTVYYLITNHSGMLLESAYLKAKEFAEYWEEKKEKNKEEENNLKFIQMEVDYPHKVHFVSIDNILKSYRDNTPVVNQKSVEIFENDESFETQYQKAVKVLDQKPPRWWDRESQNSEEQRVAEKESNRRKPINYVLRPFLIKGQASMLYASKSTGKSALGISMAAAVVSGQPLFSEKWWVVPKNPQYPMNKVLYLDFENGKTEINTRKTQLAYPYWTQNAEARAEYDNNLIVEDMTADKVDKVDYSNPANWQKIINIVEAAKNKGTPNQPVDLLVIDTLSKFVRKPYTADLNLSDFINKMRHMNIAILFLHHEGSNGEIRGWKFALDDFYFTVRLYRDDDNEKGKNDEKGNNKNNQYYTLKDPLWLAYKPSRSGEEKIAPFKVMFDKEWSVSYDEDDAEKSKPEGQRRKEELNRLADFYHSRGFQHQDIFPMLGICKETYNKLKNR